MLLSPSTLYTNCHCFVLDCIQSSIICSRVLAFNTRHKQTILLDSRCPNIHIHHIHLNTPILPPQTRPNILSPSSPVHQLNTNTNLPWRAHTSHISPGSHRRFSSLIVTTRTRLCGSPCRITVFPCMGRPEMLLAIARVQCRRQALLKYYTAVRGVWTTRLVRVITMMRPVRE